MSGATPDGTDEMVYSLVERLPRNDDVEVHLRSVTDTDNGLEYVELRYFIVSLGEYTKGVWLPRDNEILERLADGIMSIVREKS